MGEIIEVIQTLGFPVAVCIACFYFINTIIKERRLDRFKLAYSLSVMEFK